MIPKMVGSETKDAENTEEKCISINQLQEDLGLISSTLKYEYS